MIAYLRRITPWWLRATYHRTVAWLADVWYRFPSRRMIVIGVTGTHGKSSVVMFIGRILDAAGHRVGWVTTATVKIADREWLNASKMTMPGRFALQRLLRQMVDAGCTAAVVESSSEGLAQHRHAGLAYDVAVFLNLAPEHLDAHGGWERYRIAKERLFRAVAHRRPKRIGGRLVPRISIVNVDDQEAKHFLRYDTDARWGFSLAGAPNGHPLPRGHCVHPERGSIEPLDWGSRFQVSDQRYELHLPGAMYVEDALAAIAVGRALDAAHATCARALAAVAGLPGRCERVDVGQSFTAVVDYAHTPTSLEALYAAFGVPERGWPGGKVIHVLGGVGGGRDRWKRRAMGQVVGSYADVVIVTNEDPYDDEPESLIREVAAGVRAPTRRRRPNGPLVLERLDRRDGFAVAVRAADPGDLLLVTGKGCEQAIVGPRGAKTPWDDRVVLREVIQQRYALDEATEHPAR